MKAQLKEEMKNAMRAKDKIRVTTIRALLSAIQYEEMKTGNDELQEEALIDVLKSETKKRHEEIEFAEKANREDNVASLKQELDIISSFLPQQLSEEELKKILADFKGQTEGANMGAAMKHLKESYNGQYDGKLASTIAKELFV